jgi:3-methyladenine DNA glycosylase AlkD
MIDAESLATNLGMRSQPYMARGRAGKMSFFECWLSKCVAAGQAAPAAQMKKYMKNHFEFFGIASPARRAIVKDVMAMHPVAAFPSVALDDLFTQLYDHDKRESNYAAIDLYSAALKTSAKNRVVLSARDKERALASIEKAMLNKAHWDTIDSLASNVVGDLFKLLTAPEIADVADRWYLLRGSGDIWVDRTLILYQLKYKNETNTALLEKYIKRALGSESPASMTPAIVAAKTRRAAEARDCFWIAKSIGWALREYSKANPAFVTEFVARNAELLPPLSKKEALRVMLAKKPSSKKRQRSDDDDDE